MGGVLMVACKVCVMYLFHGFWALPEGTCECEVSVVTPLGFVLGGCFLQLSGTFLPLPSQMGLGQDSVLCQRNTKCML